jgi:tripartite-type tricarboxylate transporter receptor subunit TctC
LSYVSSGAGSLVHLSTGLLLKRAGLQMNPVFYKGGSTPMTDVVAGHVSTYFTTLSDVLPFAKSGTVRLLAVSSEKRLPQIPDVPTFIESGFAGFKTFTWNGLMAPAGTPRDIVERLAGEVSLAVKDPKVIERLAAFGVEPLGNRPAEFVAMIGADIATWSEAVRFAGEQDK